MNKIRTVRNFYVSINIYFVYDLCSSSNYISYSYSHFSFVSVSYTYLISGTVISDIVNDMISVIVSHAENDTSTSTSNRILTVDAKLALTNYFDRCDFPISTLLVTKN